MTRALRDAAGWLFASVAWLSVFALLAGCEPSVRLEAKQGCAPVPTETRRMLVVEAP